LSVEDDDFDPDAVIEVPITDALDLHAFAPRDVADVVASYLDEASARGFHEVRVIHGKGVGVQREIVHGVLRRHAAVESFVLADERRGGWGATIVTLRKP
jgi:dsDNA-specific endonuclease/ATPase MutS2